jgi:hypothetical protein
MRLSYFECQDCKMHQISPGPKLVHLCESHRPQMWFPTDDMSPVLEFDDRAFRGYQREMSEFVRILVEKLGWAWRGSEWDSPWQASFQCRKCFHIKRHVPREWIRKRWGNLYVCPQCGLTIVFDFASAIDRFWSINHPGLNKRELYT